MNKRTYLYFFLTIILVALVWYLSTDLNKSSPLGASQTQSTTTPSGVGAVSQLPGGGTLEVVPVDDGGGAVAPALGKPIVFTVQYSDAVKAALKTGIESIEKKIKAGDASFENWNMLATYRKQTGDYASALEIWTYLSHQYSTNSVVFINRANLYGYYLHDNAKAEVDFKKSIVNGPTEYQAYYQSILFYRDVTKDLVKARAVLDVAKKHLSPDQASDMEKLLKN